MQDDSLIRFFAFVSLFLVFSILEVVFERKKRTLHRIQRWPSNLSIVFLNSFVLRVIYPSGAVGAAFWANQNHFGVFNSMLVLPIWLWILLSIVILDLAIYGQHVMFHKVPFLWRLHRMHHTDVDLDASSGLRFHTIEIILSMAIKCGIVVIFGLSAVGVLIFEIILNGMAMFNHANLKIPKGIDSMLRMLLVTPDMHRVHHSSYPQEHHSNFGFNLSLWDRIFKTYVALPRDGHEKMQLGLPYFRSIRDQKIFALLVQPLKNKSKET